MKGLYIHIPFCVKKCSYCDFYSLPSRQDTIEPYVQAVLREAKSYSNTDCHLESFHRRTKNLVPSPSFLRRDLKGELSCQHTHFQTLYIGGGTPSLLGSKNLTTLITSLNNSMLVSSPLTGEDQVENPVLQ